MHDVFHLRPGSDIWGSRYEPEAAASATLCFPSITLWDVNVNLDLTSGNITRVTELRPFSSSSNFSSLSANVTGPPLNGRAYNGIEFNLTNPDRFVLARRNATQLQMPAAVFQAASQSPEGLIGSFQANTFARLSTNVYVGVTSSVDGAGLMAIQRTYLTLIAKTVYLLDDSEPITIQMKTVQKRIWLRCASAFVWVKCAKNWFQRCCRPSASSCDVPACILRDNHPTFPSLRPTQPPAPP